MKFYLQPMFALHHAGALAEEGGINSIIFKCIFYLLPTTYCWLLYYWL